MFIRFDSQNNIVKYRKAFDKFKVLVYHADTQIIGIIRVINLHLFAVFADFASFRLIQSEKDGHQSGFTCTVFSKQRMDFAFF